MSEDRIDPSANTQQFQAFASAGAPEPAASSKTPLVIGAVVAAIVVVALVAFLALR